MNSEQNSDVDPVVLDSQSKTFPFCQNSHALEDCQFLDGNIPGANQVFIFNEAVLWLFI